MKINLGKNAWEHQNLLKYARRSSGSMNGGSSSVILSDCGDYALLTISAANRHDEDPAVAEYLVDRKALAEIKGVFLKHRMFSWEGRRFSNHFVADGATTAYSFLFSEGDVSFSSQIFPEKYRSKLADIGAVIDRCQNSGELLPGLAAPLHGKDEHASSKEPAPHREHAPRREPAEGAISLEVCEYSQNRLHYRILNGTDEQLVCAGRYCLTSRQGEPIASNEDENEAPYPDRAHPHGTCEKCFELPARLGEGAYTLEVDGRRCTFEIAKR